jgi:hypothetical protein
MTPQLPVRRRLFVAACVTSAAIALVPEASAQSVGRNVPLVGGPTFLKLSPFEMMGDPLLAQQFEPWCVFDSRNPLRIFCIANDHRAVDISGVDAAVDTKQIIGDSMIGVFLSNDGGLSWQSRLMYGTPYDDVPSPVKHFQAAADPFAVVGPAGVIMHSSIHFNRGENPQGALAVTVWMNLNDKEDERDWAKPVFTRILELGTAGQFIDRPTMLMADGEGATATYDVSRGDGTTVTQTVPVNPAHVVWTTFVGNDQNVRSKIMTSWSRDGGFSWSAPLKVSEGFAINQAAQLAQHGSTRKLCIAWRRGESGGINNETDAMMTACSTDGGRSYSKGAVVGNLCPADQDTSATRFRMRTVPSFVADQNRFYMAYADRPRDAAGACTAADARIYLRTSPDGVAWSAAQLVDAYQGPGNQINPALAVRSDGRLNISWTDFRNDASGVFDTVIDEWRILTNAGVPQPRRRHTADVRAAFATAATAPVWSASYQVSQYIFGVVPETPVRLPSGAPRRQQLQYNPVNVRLFKTLTVPGISDYRHRDGTARAGGSCRAARHVGSGRRSTRRSLRLLRLDRPRSEWRSTTRR